MKYLIAILVAIGTVAIVRLWTINGAAALGAAIPLYVITILAWRTRNA